MRCPRLALPDLGPDGALVGREALGAAGSVSSGAAGDLLGDHRAQRVVDRAGGLEATPVVPSAHLQAADRDRGLGGGLQQDRDVDDPVLRAADDRVAAEEQHRHRSGGRVDGRHGLHRRLLDRQALRGLRLLEGEVLRRPIRLPGLQRDDRQAVAPHRHDRRDRCDRATHGGGRTRLGLGFAVDWWCWARFTPSVR